MDIDAQDWITTHWRKGDRYYVAELMQDLFGSWIVKRSWGSIHTHRGRSITLCANDYEHALKLLQNVEKRRKARGYTPDSGDRSFPGYPSLEK